MPLLTENTLAIAGKKKLEPFRHPELVKTDAVKLVNETVDTLVYYKRGTVFAQIGASRLFAPYNNAGSGGAEVAKCILVYDTVVRAPISAPTPDTPQAYWFGNWTTAFPGPHGEFVENVIMYFGGDFLSSDLYVGAGTAEDTAVRLDTTNTHNSVDLLAALADMNATIGITTALATGIYPDIFEFRF